MLPRLLDCRWFIVIRRVRNRDLVEFTADRNRCLRNPLRWNTVWSGTIDHCVVQNGRHHMPRRSFINNGSLLIHKYYVFYQSFGFIPKVLSAQVSLSSKLNTTTIDNRLVTTRNGLFLVGPSYFDCAGGRACVPGVQLNWAVAGSDVGAPRNAGVWRVILTVVLARSLAQRSTQQQLQRVELSCSSAVQTCNATMTSVLSVWWGGGAWLVPKLSFFQLHWSL